VVLGSLDKDPGGSSLSLNVTYDSSIISTASAIFALREQKKFGLVLH
jgi:hypothetical protein